MTSVEINWPEALRSTGGEYAATVDALRQILLSGLRIALRDRRDVGEAQLEDFTQDALLRILDQLDQFRGRSKFTTWAHTITLNIAFTELRRKRWQDVSLDALTADGRLLHEPATMPDSSSLEDAESNRILAALREAVATHLTERQRAAIAGELSGLPFDQISQLLGLNRNAAYKLLHDARRALKRHLVARGVSADDIRTAFSP